MLSFVNVKVEENSSLQAQSFPCYLEQLSRRNAEKNSITSKAFRRGLINFKDYKALWINWQRSWTNLPADNFCGISTGLHSLPSTNVYTLQMKGRWESNKNVWFPFMYSQKWNCYFQNRIVMFCLPVPTLINLWESYTYISKISLSILLHENMWTDPGNT